MGTTPTANRRAPGAVSRGEWALRRIDKAIAQIDGALGRWIPKADNPLVQAGQVANLCLVLAVVTGVLMLVWYSPSSQFAYDSLKELEAFSMGAAARAAHRYSSDLLMLFLFIHAGRVFFARKFAGPRWLPWTTGVGLMALVWFIGWTGYWLVWDRPAQQVAITSMQLLDALPLFGEPLGRLYFADRLVPSLLFFVVFFLHMLLPLGIAVGLVAHLLRLSRVRLLPPWPLCAAMTVALIAVSVAIPAPLDPPAEMAVKAEQFTVDAWYLTPLALGLRFQGPGLWAALFGGVGLAALVPWILGRRREPNTYQAEVEVSRCHACTQCAQDCPFDAIAMAPRTDGKRFDAQASVDPARCVGCGVCAGSCDSEGIGLAWFPTASEEQRIRSAFAAALARGGSDWVALVPNDVDGSVAPIDRYLWQKRLPGYQVFGVPTASWVRPKLVERLLRDGASGVLIVRDGSGETQARDGGRWVEARLRRERAPMFRPARAGGNDNWEVIDFEAGNFRQFAQAAEAFRKGAPQPVAKVSRFKMAAAVLLLAAALGAAAVGPSHLVVSNPAPMGPEIVFSFKAMGDQLEPPAEEDEDDDRLPHMRGRSLEKPRRSPVRVRLTVDGEAEERRFAPKGLSNDGPSIGVMRRLVEPGRRRVEIEVRRGPQSETLRWAGWVNAQDGRLIVVTYETGYGFRME